MCMCSDSSDPIDIKQGKKSKVEVNAHTQMNTPVLQKFQYPNKVDGISAELFQHVYVNFRVKNKQSGKEVHYIC